MSESKFAIGIDLHKKTSHIIVLDTERDIVVLDKNIRTRPERFEAELKKYEGSKVLIEASGCSRWVALHLEQMGLVPIVGDPNYALMYASRRANCKNDREDARALAVACKNGHYKQVHIRSAESRQILGALGSRDVILGQRTALVNRVRAIFFDAGKMLPSCVAEEFRVRVKEFGVPRDLECSVRPLLNLLAGQEDALNESDKMLAAFAEKHEIAKLLQTVPGVKVITSLAFIATIDTVERFPTAHKVESYIGLAPRVHESARPNDNRSISKMGSVFLRSVLANSAWAFLRSNDPRTEPIKAWAERLLTRKERKVVAIALARRLAGILFAMWRDKKPFEIREYRPQPPVKKYQLKEATNTVPLNRRALIISGKVKQPRPSIYEEGQA